MNQFDVLTKILQKKLHDFSLSMDEGRVIWEARQRIKCTTPKVMVGDFNPPPSGYLDSTVNLGLLEFPRKTKIYCDHLVSKNYLCRHRSRAGMVRISDWLIPVCDEIINGFNFQRTV